MCGIVGFTNIETNGSEIFQSLQKLEYRGYDSSGIALINHSGDISVEKSAGRLANIEAKVAKLTGSTGIGHTRWATHGIPNDTNAHPHSNGEIAIVHNGIIENYFALKSRLEDFKPTTDTDTEIILKLIESELAEGLPMAKALMKVANKIEGSFSVLVMQRTEPGRLYAMRSSLPLIVGKGKERSIVASDTIGLPSDCEKIFLIPDCSVVEISAEKVMSWDFSGVANRVKFDDFKWSNEELSLQGFEHYMIKEIYEQPRILKNLIEERVNQKAMEIEDVNGVQGLNLGKIDHIQIVACGTAFHAGLLGKYYIEQYTRLPVTVELASEFRYSCRPLTPKTLLIAISQSGETADTLSCVAAAKEANCQIVAFCNRPQAEIPRLSTKTIPLECGAEVSVASTKAFTSMLLCLYLFALSCGRNRGLLKRELFATKLENLNSLPHLVNRVIQHHNSIQSIGESLTSAKAVFFVGRRNSYPIALEGALKLKEVSYIQSEGYAGGELKHGPLALIEKDTPVIAIAPMDKSFPKTLSNVFEAKSRLAKIISVTNESDGELSMLSDQIIEIPSVDEDLSPFLTTPVAQLLTYFAARKLGTDIDKPRNLAKSVTVE